MKTLLLAMFALVWVGCAGAEPPAAPVETTAPVTQQQQPQAQPEPSLKAEPQITPGMAQCIADCRSNGQPYQTCWDCCVLNRCPVL